jgi:uncharacterized membrane protein YbaN (DUF454 family)
MRPTIVAGSPSGKIVACVAVVALVVVGVIGLVLPIIPGVLVLAIAALVAAKHFPSVDAQLRRHRAIRERLDQAHRASDLDVAAKVQLAGWYCLKMVIAGLELGATFVAKLRAPAR